MQRTSTSAHIEEASIFMWTKLRVLPQRLMHAVGFILHSHLHAQCMYTFYLESL